MIQENNDLAVKWVEALRSGKYKQGFGALRTVETDGTMRHCVVGVLADVIDPNAWESGAAFDDGSIPKVVWNDCTFGIEGSEYGIDDNVIDEVMRLNDNETHDFNKLADFLEEHLSGTEIAG